MGGEEEEELPGKDREEDTEHHHPGRQAEHSPQPEGQSAQQRELWHGGICPAASLATRVVHFRSEIDMLLRVALLMP